MLDAAVLATMGDLELVSRVVVDGTISGLHRSPFHGYSAEFSQYRHYRPGDDLKYVDWKLFARTDRFYTKQFRETTNAFCQIALDASASMAYRGRAGVTKFEYARILAASLAHLIVRQGDAAGLVTFANGLREYLPSRGGQPHLHALLLALARTDAAGETHAATALNKTIDLMRRRGLLVLISDLYDEDDDVERALKRAAHAGHEVVIFHVLSRDEIELPFDGDVEVADLETGRTLLSNAALVGTTYREEVAEFLERWRSRCATYGADYVRVVTDMPLDRVLRGYLHRRAAGPVT
jgi:uncharacterized protein (DUF58 family)